MCALPEAENFRFRKNYYPTPRGVDARAPGHGPLYHLASADGLAWPEGLDTEQEWRWYYLILRVLCTCYHYMADRRQPEVFVQPIYPEGLPSPGPRDYQKIQLIMRARCQTMLCSEVVEICWSWHHLFGSGESPACFLISSFLALTSSAILRLSLNFASLAFCSSSAWTTQTVGTVKIR